LKNGRMIILLDPQGILHSVHHCSAMMDSVQNDMQDSNKII
jgi:hypothetical protein